MGKKRKKKNYRFRDDCFYIGPLKEEEEEGVCLIFGSFVVTHHTSLYRIQMSKPHRRRRRKKILKEACHFDPMHFTLRIKFDFFLLSISFISMWDFPFATVCPGVCNHSLHFPPSVVQRFLVRFDREPPETVTRRPPPSSHPLYVYARPPRFRFIFNHHEESDTPLGFPSI